MRAAVLLRRLVCCLSVLVLASCASAPPPPSPVARGDLAAVTGQLTALVAQELRAGDLAGLSLALVDERGLLWSHGAGWADREHQRAADAHTLYRVGSVSKLFTDTAAMQLVAQGRLALDAPVTEVLPWWRQGGPQGEADVTLRQLMTHHAGLPRDRLAGMWGEAGAPGGDWRAALRAQADEAPAAPPGLVFGYSNLGLDLVGALIEQAAGRPFEQQLQRALLQPLGMDGASFSAAPPEAPPMARPYYKGQPRVEPGLRDVPAGGLNASVADLARFVAMQLDQGRNAAGAEVLAPAAWAEMQRVQNADVALDASLRLGLGWMQTTFGPDTVHGGGPVLHHAGATFYHRAQLMMLPAQRVGVVVASNDGAAGAAVSRIAQRALALLLQWRTGQAQPPREPGFVPARQPWSPAQRQACAGEYVTVVGAATVTLDGDRLAVRLGSRTLALREGEDGQLALGYRLLGLLPVSLGFLDHVGLGCETVAGRALLVARHDGERLVVGERRRPDATLSPAEAARLQRLAGLWRPVPVPGEVPTVESVRLHVEDGRLWAEPRLAEPFRTEGARLPVLLRSGTEAVLLAGPLADVGGTVSLLPQPDGSLRWRHAGWTFERTGD